MSRSASSTTQLPEVVPVISSALMMSTPAATSVESVRAKRAIVTLRTTSPIFIGTFSLMRSHCFLPPSLAFQRWNRKMVRAIAGKMMYQRVRMQVGRGDHELRQLREAAVELHVELLEDRDDEEEHRHQDEEGEGDDHRRVDHGALDPALEVRLLLDLGGEPVEDVVEDAGRLAGLDHRDVDAREDLRVLGERLRREAHRPRRRCARRRSRRRGACRRSAPRGC